MPPKRAREAEGGGSRRGAARRTTEVPPPPPPPPPLPPLPPPPPVFAFPAARAGLEAALAGLSLARVASVRAADGREGAAEPPPGDAPFYTFVAKEVGGDRTFFGTRSTRSMINHGGLVVGAAHLVDAPLGRTHVSAYPKTGDLIVGFAEPNRVNPEKAGSAGAPSHFLTQWNGCGPVVAELARIAREGGALTPSDLVRRLAQPASPVARAILAAEARKTPGSDSTPAMRGLRVTRDAEHEVAALALVAVFGDVRALAVQASIEEGRQLVEPATADELEAPHIWLSTPVSAFVKALCVSLGDGAPAAAFEACFAPLPEPPADPPLAAQTADQAGHGAAMLAADWVDDTGAPYYPVSPLYEPAGGGTSPPRG